MPSASLEESNNSLRSRPGSSVPGRREGLSLSIPEVIRKEGLAPALTQIHDDLGAARFDAYGWPSTPSYEEILERLVALDAGRAEEERRGLLRWLRPGLQDPGPERAANREALPGGGDEEDPVAKGAAPLPWPKAFPGVLSRTSSVRPDSSSTNLACGRESAQAVEGEVGDRRWGGGPRPLRLELPVHLAGGRPALDHPALRRFAERRSGRMPQRACRSGRRPSLERVRIA